MNRVAAAASGAVLIAQMTDIHIGFAPDEKPEELNLTRFRATLKRLIEGPNRPDWLVLTGDITDHGDAESFAKTIEILHACPIPILPMVGNQLRHIQTFDLAVDHAPFAADQQAVRRPVEKSGGAVTRFGIRHE